jgi:hypothetical protein
MRRWGWGRISLRHHCNSWAALRHDADDADADADDEVDQRVTTDR